jgi:hypothetical protein
LFDSYLFPRTNAAPFLCTQVEGNALGAACQAACEVLGQTGGKVTAFLSNLPTVGAGALKARDDNALYGTPKEKQLFVPQVRTGRQTQANHWQ